MCHLFKKGEASHVRGQRCVMAGQYFKPRGLAAFTSRMAVMLWIESETTTVVAGDGFAAAAQDDDDDSDHDGP